MSITKPSTFLSTSLHAVSGTVSNLNNELLEYVNPEKPTHDDSPIYYKRFFISKFNLGDKAIEAKFSTPLKIADGDVLTVSGYAKDETFQVLAYQNASQQISGHENWVMLALGALFFAAVALGLLNSELVAEIFTTSGSKGVFTYSGNNVIARLAEDNTGLMLTAQILDSSRDGYDKKTDSEHTYQNFYGWMDECRR